MSDPKVPETEFLELNKTIDSQLREMAFFYQAGREDMGEQCPEGGWPSPDWPEVYAALMVGTGGSLGTVGLDRLFDAWRERRLPEWIQANALTDDMRTLALGAYCEICGDTAEWCPKAE